MYQQYIGGKLVTGLGKPLDVLDPSTGEVVGTVGSANAAQAQQALDAAAEAFKTWSKTPLQTRIDWMLKLREACLAEPRDAGRAGQPGIRQNICAGLRRPLTGA